MHVSSFSEIETEFIERVHTMVWCSAATIDSQDRPRSRLLHPIWEGAVSGAVGWVATHRDSLKAKHLARNPYVSLAYVAHVMQPVYVDCRTEWVDDLAEKRRVWELFKAPPPPLGFDPAHDFISPDHESFGLLRLIPWRVDLVSFPAESFEVGTRVWKP
ncbi:MAG: pyridoxamine 5'-phosphate oxidase family protein [bacterium]|nr:pyridoxamine 5'-phosphate oxidase family protein [bacterium]